MHDRTGTPPGRGAPKGNQNAAGNSGGGAPVGNANARKYGSWSDPLKEYHRLDERGQAHVDELVREALGKSKAELSEETIRIKAKQLAVLSIMHSAGWAYACGDDGEGLVVTRERELEDGSTVIDPVLNPAIEGNRRNNLKEEKLWEELRLFPTPDGRPATAHD